MVGEAGDGTAAVSLAQQTTPDVVVMDIRMPGMDGLTATRLITELPSPPKVLVLTTFDLDVYVYDALRAGSSGFMLKDAEPEELLTAIRVVAAGDGILAPAVTRRLIGAFAQGAPVPTDATGALAVLTPRERPCFRAVLTGRLHRSATPTRRRPASELYDRHRSRHRQVVVTAEVLPNRQRASCVGCGPPEDRGTHRSPGLGRTHAAANRQHHLRRP